MPFSVSLVDILLVPTKRRPSLPNTASDKYINNNKIPLTEYMPRSSFRFRFGVRICQGVRSGFGLVRLAVQVSVRFIPGSVWV